MKYDENPMKGEGDYYIYIYHIYSSCSSHHQCHRRRTSIILVGNPTD